MTVFKTDDLVEILRLTYQDKKSSRYIAEKYGCSKSSIGNFLRKETYTDFWEAHSEKPIAGGEIHTPDDVRKTLTGKRFVFTSAQNNSYVHTKFMDTLEGYCDHNNAELIVGTFLYNKNGFQGGKQDEVWFDPRIRKYILNESREIAKGLIWCGELNVSPSAVNPLSGLYNYTNTASGIVPSTKMQLESLATSKHETCRMMYSTGTVTQRNYMERKAGQRAKHHHSFSALVVEVAEDGEWFCRQLCAEKLTGNFFDLEYYYTPDGIAFDGEPCCVEAINFGDIHAAKLDHEVAEISWGTQPDSIMETLQPSYLLLHDIFDMKNRNHHNIKDPYFRFKMQQGDTDCVREEVEQTVQVMMAMTGRGAEVVVAESNHDLALESWLKIQDYRNDPVNAIFFLELQLQNYYAMQEGKSLRTFETACHLVDQGTEVINFLTTDESFLLCGNIEAGMHGDLGASGSRGSIGQFQKTGIKMNIGHSHAAAIKDGVFQAGVSGLMDMGYNRGLSGWSHSHIITYANGKRCIVTLKSGKWRG